jgi:hypothetical protein
MFDFIAHSTLAWGFSSAIIDVDVSTKRFAHKIAHHRYAFVVRREPSSFDFETFFVWTINRPPYV